MGRVNSSFGGMVCSAAVVGLLASACRSPRFYYASYSNDPSMAGGGMAGPSGASGDPMAMLNVADRALRARNYQPMGQAFRQAMSERGLVAYPIPAQPGMCYAVLVIGGAGVGDVDMTVVAPSGTPLGQDNAPDAHPTVSFCATEYGQHLARVNMYRGAGEVLYAVYQAPAGVSPVDSAMLYNDAGSGGAAGAATASAPNAPDPDTQARIDAMTAQLTGQGYQAPAAPVGLAMARGQENTWQVPLQAGGCYAFATFGGPGVSDSDVFLFDASGARRLASDAGTSADAVIRDFCPPVAGTYQLRARLYAGTGPVWVMSFARSGRAGGGPSTGPAVAISRTSSSGGLDNAYRVIERALQSRGYAAAVGSVTGELAANTSADQAVDLQQGSCYAITAVGDSGAQDIDLFLLDSSNRELDRDHAQNSQPIVRVCPETSGRFTMRVRMTAGEGRYRAGLFRWEGGTSGAGMRGLLFVRNAELTRILQADGYQADASFDIVRARIRENASVSHPVTLQAGACYAFIAVGGDGVSDLNLRLSRGRDVIAEDSSPSAFPAARYCATERGQFQITIRSAVGSGEFVYRVFRRQAPGAGR
jgi:hypothetical protein